MPDFIYDIFVVLADMSPASLVAAVAISFCFASVVSVIALFRFLGKLIDKERGE